MFLVCTRGPVVVAHLKLWVNGLDIVVTMPGTEHRVTFQKPADGRDLIPKPEPSPVKDVDAGSRKKFLAQAWQAASDKARELGWIV